MPCTLAQPHKERSEILTHYSTLIETWINKNLCKFTHVYAHPHKLTHTHERIYTSKTFTHAHTYTRTLTHTRAHTHIHTQHTHAHMHARACARTRIHANRAISHIYYQLVLMCAQAQQHVTVPFSFGSQCQSFACGCFFGDYASFVLTTLKLLASRRNASGVNQRISHEIPRNCGQ